jgi:hypothetical protein
MIGINSGRIILSLMPVDFKRISGEPGAIKTGLFLECPSPDFEIPFLTIKEETH